MEASTNIRAMIVAGKQIVVPDYQRAYSWETPRKQRSIKTHTDVFLSDLDEYRKYSSTSGISYYFGHFLFEQKNNSKYFVVDGQQRLTTIVIFLCALFKKMKSLRELSDDEKKCREDMVKDGSNYRFSTVDYDNLLFRDYVVDDQNTKNKKGLETESAKRIVDAFDYFEDQLNNKDRSILEGFLNVIENASCTTHTVQDESLAIQMFIFQNNRGKQPSKLEVLKAQFMHYIHLHGGENREGLLQEIKQRFANIYKSISSISHKIDEDDVLICTSRIYFNTLWESDAQEKINQELSPSSAVSFVKNFVQLLQTSFDHLKTFFTTDELNSHAIHSLVTLGTTADVTPFIVKAYQFGLDTKTIEKLCSALESLVLRHRLIGTRAEIRSRIQEEFKNFTSDNKLTKPIIDRVENLKTANDDDWWWCHWNNKSLKNAIQGALAHPTAKFLLWKYENYLESQGKAGYERTRFDKIIDPELEHIAPTTEPKTKPHGYDTYDEVFFKDIDCLGNYLLLSKSHNCSIGNINFSEKLKSYTELKQHQEIQKLVGNSQTWDRDVIRRRKETIVDFIMANL